MRRMRWTVYLWPGLPQIARGGGWAALVVAVGAAVLLNAALVTTWIWPDWIARELRIISWALLAVTWVAAAGVSARSDRRRKARSAQPDDDGFREALLEYLKGNWFGTEQVLARLLHRDRDDPEARLMLATLLRRTRRLDEATRELNFLARLDRAESWAWETRREGELLRQARQPAADADDAEPIERQVEQQIEQQVEQQAGA
ncbi:MAG: hypothetical protein ABSF26_28890 [Thermoguttaceae bacterium]